MADTESVGTKLDAVVAAGANGTVIALLKRLTTDIGGFVAGTATQRVEGEVAHGAAIASVNPVLIGISDGTSNFRAPGTAANGLQVQGQAADNTTATGYFPLVVAGSGSGRVGGTVNPFTNSGQNSDVLNLSGIHTTWVGAFPMLFTNSGQLWERLRIGSAAAGTAIGAMAACCMVHDGTNYQMVRQLGTGSDGAAATSVRGVSVGVYDFNSSTYDRRRNNVEANLITAAASTTSPNNSSDTTNYNAKGVMLYLSVSVNPGAAATLTLNLQAKDETGNDEYVTIATTGALFGAGGTGLESLLCYPGAAETAAVATLVTQALPLPRTWRAQVVLSAGTWSYKVSYSYIN